MPGALRPDACTPAPPTLQRGHHSAWDREHDDLQVCAQAMCLEEMTGLSVPRGAIYHHSSRRRREVVFDEGLRRRVAEAVAAIRAMLSAKALPEPVNDQRCERCSLQESCMPAVIGEQRRAKPVLRGLFSIQDS